MVSLIFNLVFDYIISCTINKTKKCTYQHHNDRIKLKTVLFINFKAYVSQIVDEIIFWMKFLTILIQ